MVAKSRSGDDEEEEESMTAEFKVHLQPLTVGHRLQKFVMFRSIDVSVLEVHLPSITFDGSKVSEFCIKLTEPSRSHALAYTSTANSLATSRQSCHIQFSRRTPKVRLFGSSSDLNTLSFQLIDVATTTTLTFQPGSQLHLTARLDFLNIQPCTLSTSSNVPTLMPPFRQPHQSFTVVVRSNDDVFRFRDNSYHTFTTSSLLSLCHVDVSDYQIGLQSLHITTQTDNRSSEQETNSEPRLIFGVILSDPDIAGSVINFEFNRPSSAFNSVTNLIDDLIQFAASDPVLSHTLTISRVEGETFLSIELLTVPDAVTDHTTRLDAHGLARQSSKIHLRSSEDSVMERIERSGVTITSSIYIYVSSSLLSLFKSQPGGDVDAPQTPTLDVHLLALSSPTVLSLALPVKSHPTTSHSQFPYSPMCFYIYSSAVHPSTSYIGGQSDAFLCAIHVSDTKEVPRRGILFEPHSILYRPVNAFLDTAVNFKFKPLHEPSTQFCNLCTTSKVHVACQSVKTTLVLHLKSNK